MQKIRRYERLDKIGQGSFGKVYKVRDRKSKKYFVLKEIDLSVLTPKNIREAENEVKILNVLDHENILSFIDSYKFQGKFKSFYKKNDIYKPDSETF
jgi:NIMA (never in mitosis gene a)-related kinase